MVLNQQQCCPKGTFGNSIWRNFHSSQLGQGESFSGQIEARDAVEHSTMCRTSYTTKNYVTKNVHSSVLESPHIRIQDNSQLYIKTKKCEKWIKKKQNAQRENNLN